MVDVTVLVDNTVATPVPKGLRGEWGFAAAVGDVLFDTGQSDAVAHNARLLGRDGFDTVVLSHTHWDHTAGLRDVLLGPGRHTVYCHPDLWTPRYVTERDDGTELEDPVHIGVPFAREEVAAAAEVVEHRDPVEVAPGVTALGEIPREHPDTTVGKRREDGTFVDDPVPDDQALAVETGDGLLLVLGCGHAGLRNTVEYAESVCGEQVRHVVGGTHLVALDAEAVHEVADWLDGRLDTVAGTHCTGFEAQTILSERLPDAFQNVGVGTTLTFGARD